MIRYEMRMKNSLFQIYKFILNFVYLPIIQGFQIELTHLINSMIVQGNTTVKGWAQSTQSKIKQFIDDFLINYPQENVRKSTEKLLASLFRKGSQLQRINIINLLTERVSILNSMGKPSKQFLSLITNIFENFKEPAYQKQKEILFNSVIQKTKEIFNKTVTGKEYNFYSLCANMIDFGEEFKPYLLEANGCLKCFGKPQVQFESASLNSIREELRAHLHSVEWILKRRYEINNLQVKFNKKKIGYKTITIYHYDENGVKKELGKFTPNDNIPPFNLVTNSIGITFQFAKARRNHISCIVCSNAEEYSTVCSGCITKMIDMQGKIKVVGGSPQKINKELAEAFKNFNGLRNQLQKFAESVENQSKANLMKNKIIQEMQTVYLNIIQNLRLLRDVSESQLSNEKKIYQDLNTDCYSCHFYQFNACIQFILNALKKSYFKVNLEQIVQLITDFRIIFARNKIHSNTLNISYILAQLFSKVENVNYFDQINLNQSNNDIVANLLNNLIQHIKKQKKDDSSLLPIKNYIFNPDINKYFTVLHKISLFVVLILNDEQLFFLNQSQQLEPEKLQDIKRLSLDQYAEYKALLTFNITDIFNYNITNIIKLYLILLPEELIPESNLQISDPGYLKYIKTVLPIINEELILSNVVFTPNPIIKLNLFRLLPQIIQQLPLQASIELIKQLCKFRPLWNTHIRQTIQSFDKMLDEVEKERKLMLCLQGYEVSKQSLYFEHIYKILTPQRPNFIIRLEIPQKEMQKQEKNKGGPVEYIYLPVREVRSEDLKGDTIGALHLWITQQIRKLNQDMAFDLIVQNNIVDNLDLSLEIIYKKIVQKEVKRQIGNKTYDFFRVIYRIQGIFGEANERNCGNPRDQKLEECITFSSYLINRLQNTKRTGLNVLMDIIPTLQQKNQSRQRRDKMIKILDIIFRNETIIQKLVQWQYGSHILRLAVKFISFQKHEIKTTQNLLEMCSKVIDEVNKVMVKVRKNSQSQGSRKMSETQMDVEGEQGTLKTVKYLLEKVKQAEQNGFKNISKKLIKILPYYSKDDYNSSRFLMDYFELGRILQLKYTQKLTWLLQFIQALSQSFISMKNLCRDQGITQKIIEFVMAGLFASQGERHKDSIQNLQLCLTMLKGLMQGDVSLQEYLFERGILQQVYKIGGMNQEVKSKMGRIPSICFEIVKYFQEGTICSPKVKEYFAQNTQKKRKAIQNQKNQRKLQIMNKKKKAMESFQHLIKNEENELLRCSSCKQGYKSKKQVLGVYLYSSKIEILSLQNWWKDNKKIQSITSTSYFEPIHLECHNNAVKDDLKIQKTEWDGAIIRNSEVLCNNWCAFKGPQTTDQEFDKCLKKYFQKNNKISGFWIVLNDLNGLLEKFSKEYDFSHETKGSSYTHNARLIPVLIVLASHLMKSNQELKFLKEGITHIEENPTKKPNLIHLYFCLLLFNCNYQRFFSKRGFCLKLIENLGYGNFKDSKPYYVYLALVQDLMKLTNNFEGDGFEAIILNLNSYIPKNFTELMHDLQRMTENYKNTYLKWQNIEQAKKYFQN